MPELLSVRAITRRFGQRTVLDSVDLDVAAGEAIGVVGPNGSGKSTLLRCIVGADEPDSGEVSLSGRELDERNPEIRRDLAIVMDDIDFFPDLCVVEHLDLVARAHGERDAHDLVGTVLDEVGLADVSDQLPSTLSSGQRRRLALASVFVRPRRLLVLDEPEQRLDVEGVAWLGARSPGPDVAVLEAARAAEVRRQVRRWRRARADLNFRDVFDDAYIALFAVVMVGSVAGSVLLDLRRLADVSCAGACEQVRTLGPWWSALAVMAIVLGVARLLGPIFSPPAANAWLLSTPIDRGDLLRPGWWRTVVLTGVGSAAVLVAPALLGGFDLATVGVLVMAGSAASLACVAVAALSQLHEHAAARRLTWTLTASLWVLLVLAASDRLGALPAVPTLVGWGLAGACLLLAVILTWRAFTSLPATSRRVLIRTEHLSSSLSGALAALDLGLMFDVMLARRWGQGARVTSRTGGPLGWWALVHRDLRRAVRAPQPYVVLAAMIALPYAAAAAGAGRPVVLATTLGGLLAGPALCVGLRVVVRTRGLARMWPLSGGAVRSAHIVVPGLALVGYGIASTGALLPTMPPGEAVAVAVACGLSALAATIRWVTAQPPDYAKPMVSTPAGAVPPGVILSVFRGFDVWALTALPLTFAGWGVIVSALLSLAVITFLVSQDPA